ncbi:hypothetical protein [Deinococcus koreensis]|uniref:Uncharacterized protein n=1 Tax=Deinococcus koreensis TaxID=2054903 RepID=A0A2K3URX4_9DEIO|nr:hypothetical protein [Deinococcus koreensis]PNY79267.1 hypothetical protein CVO96_20360 [Deinococcus koreensis]
MGKRVQVGVDVGDREGLAGQHALQEAPGGVRQALGGGLLALEEFPAPVAARLRQCQPGDVGGDQPPGLLVHGAHDGVDLVTAAGERGEGLDELLVALELGFGRHGNGGRRRGAGAGGEGRTPFRPHSARLALTAA